MYLENVTHEEAVSALKATRERVLLMVQPTTAPPTLLSSAAHSPSRKLLPFLCALPVYPFLKITRGGL